MPRTGFVGEHRALEEIHLSHNQLQVAGIEAILKGVAEARIDAETPLYPKKWGANAYGPNFGPLWIRVENIGQPHEVKNAFVEELTGALQQKRREHGWL